MLPYPGLEKVISGAQTGADRAGLLAAEQLGIATGGFMPKGFLASDGKQPLFAARFGVEEHRSPLYPPRTRDNIRAACATLCLEGQVRIKRRDPHAQLGHQGQQTVASHPIPNRASRRTNPILLARSGPSLDPPTANQGAQHCRQ